MARPDAGRGGRPAWAWDTAPQPGSRLTPVTIYGHFQAPAVPAPGPACLPGTRADTGRGPGVPGPSMAMCPPRCQGPGPRGRGKIPSETQSQPLLRGTRDQRNKHLTEKCTSVLPEPEKQPPLKGIRTPLTSWSTCREGASPEAPRRGLLTFSLPAGNKKATM